MRINDAAITYTKFDTLTGATYHENAGTHTGGTMTLYANPGGADAVRGDNSIRITTTTSSDGGRVGLRFDYDPPAAIDITGCDYIGLVCEFLDDTAYQRSDTVPTDSDVNRGLSFHIASRNPTTIYGGDYSILQFYGAREPLTVMILKVSDLDGAPDLSAIDEARPLITQRDSGGGPVDVVFHGWFGYKSADVVDVDKSPVLLLFDDCDIEQGPVASGGWLYDELASRDLVKATTLCITKDLVGGANMSEADIQLYYDNGACIVNHAGTHFDLDSTATAAALADIDEGQAYIESKGWTRGNVCKAYVPPFGRMTAAVYNGLLARDYKLCRTTAKPLYFAETGNTNRHNQTLFNNAALGPKHFMFLRTMRFEAPDTESDTAAEHITMLTDAREARQASFHYGHEFVTSAPGARQFLRSEMETFLDEVETQVNAGTLIPSTLTRGPDSFAAIMGLSDVTDTFYVAVGRRTLQRRPQGLR